MITALMEKVSTGCPSLTQQTQMNTVSPEKYFSFKVLDTCEMYSSKGPP